MKSKLCRVVNIRTNPNYDLYVGRGTLFGNKWSHKDLPNAINVGSRTLAIAKYRLWFHQQVKDGHISISYLRTLKGKTLGCSCLPLPCHAQVIADFVNSLPDEDSALS
ncbi:hypothetical protein [Escherichia phage EP_H11]|nr:hypothetical protein [Escherichia phage EP_H11]